MSASITLLKCIAKTLVKCTGNAVGGIAGDLVVGLAEEVWNAWGEGKKDAEWRAELEAIARATASEMTAQITEAMRETGAAQQDLSLPVAAYLRHIPAMVRQHLRRPSDPTGTTVPANLVLKKAEDLLRFLPTKLPRFKPGDYPLPGVDWQLDQLLGVGGFGEVWKARNPHLSSVEPVALKLCLDSAAAKVLRNEAAVLDRVMRTGKHPGIVQLFRTYLSAEIPCLEYEYVEGGDLGGLIQEWHRAREGPTQEQAGKVILRLAEIMAFAHRQQPPIVHRDLKPANILLQPSRDGESAFKIADFGIGGIAISQAVQETQAGLTKGAALLSAIHGSYTPLYASPQQMRGAKPDPRDDVYALGVIWHQLLTGDLRSGRPGGSRWRRNLCDKGMSQEMADLLEACFEENPEDRPADAGHLTEKIMQCLSPSKDTSGHAEVSGENLALAKSHYNQGIQHSKKGQHDKAIFHYTTAIQLHPGYARAFLNRGAAHLKTGKYDLAIADCSTAIRLDPAYSLAFYNRGKAFQKKKEYDKARGDYTRAISLDPQNPLAYKSRAETCKQIGDHTQAIADYSQAILLTPADAELYHNRALMQLKMGDHDKAIEDSTRAIHLDPEDPATYINRAMALGKKELYREAAADFSEALRLDPQNTSALNNFAWLCATCPVAKYRDGKKAVQYARQACELSKWKKWHMIDTLAASYAESGLFDDAIAWQQKSLEIAPADQEKVVALQKRLEQYHARVPYRTAK